MMVRKFTSTKGRFAWERFVFPIIIVLGLLYYWHVNPLPDDKEMIAHFQANRAEIIELVESFRTFEKTEGTRVWGEIPENIEKMEKAGVKRVKSLIPMWFSNPYSTEAAKQFYELMRQEQGIRGNLYHSIGVELVNEARPNTPYGHVLISSGYQLIFKELVYFPIAPRVVDGKLLWPVTPAGKERGRRVVPNFDDYPPDWKRGECVYREIETQWFIYMCITA